MKKTVLFISIILLISCNSRNINGLNKETIDYRSLPHEVKSWIFEVNFKDLNQPNKYYTERRQERLFPWIYHIDIHRKTDDKIFETELNGEHGSRYIIYKDYLFIPNHYNIYKADSLDYTFTRFHLD